MIEYDVLRLHCQQNTAIAAILANRQLIAGSDSDSDSSSSNESDFTDEDY